MWNVEEQSQRAQFMNHMYKCSGRTNGLYTGLWEEFCLNEAGPYCRQLFFERQKAISDFITHAQTLSGVAADCQQDQCKEEFITTFHDQVNHRTNQGCRVAQHK